MTGWRSRMGQVEAGPPALQATIERVIELSELDRRGELLPMERFELESLQRAMQLDADERGVVVEYQIGRGSTVLIHPESDGEGSAR